MFLLNSEQCFCSACESEEILNTFFGWALSVVLKSGAILIQVTEALQSCPVLFENKIFIYLFIYFHSVCSHAYSIESDFVFIMKMVLCWIKELGKKRLKLLITCTSSKLYF